MFPLGWCWETCGGVPLLSSAVVDMRQRDRHIPRGLGKEGAVADVRKISVALTREQMADVEAAVASGAYASAAEIVQEAITAWRLAHALRDDEIRRLGELWDAGKAGGATRPFDIERTLATARTRLGKAAAE